MTISCKRFSPTICLSKLSYKQDAKVLKGHPTLRSTCGRPLWGYQESTSKLPGCHHGHDNGPRPQMHPESQTPQQKRSGVDHWGRKKGLRDNTRGNSLRSIPFVMSGHLIFNFFQTLGLPIFNTNPNNGCPKRIYQHSGQAHKHFSHRFHGVSFLADVQT